MQNLNQPNLEMYGTTTQGFDFQYFQYGDFTLVPDPTVATTVAVNSQNVVADNSFTEVAVNHVNPQIQEHSVWLNSSIPGDEVFEDFHNINFPKPIFASHHTISDEKTLLSGFNKDDVAVISKEEFIRKENEPPKKPRSAAQKNEIHNQSEKNRRNAIKERIHTLRKLIPNCNKTDQASILSDAANYLKCLQCQHQMLSMTYMPYLPMDVGMGIGMGIVNTCGHPTAGRAGLPFQSVPSTPIPNSPIISDSSIVSFPQFQDPPPSLSPATFNPAQMWPTVNSSFDINTVAQPQLIPYPINLAHQGESSTSQYNTQGAMDHSQNVPIFRGGI